MSAQGAIIRTGPYPELTTTAVLVGYFLGVVIAVSIGYASLILGFSIEGSELAAILGFAILRGMLRRSSIIENNIVQTVASEAGPNDLIILGLRHQKGKRLFSELALHVARKTSAATLMISRRT